MICMNYDHNKKFGLLKFHSGYGKFYFNSPKGYTRKIINAQTDAQKVFIMLIWRLWMLQIQNKLFLNWVAKNICDFSYNILNSSQKIKQILFQDKIYFWKRLFNIDDVTNYDHVFYDACCFCWLKYVQDSR